jgi:electron transport complex protein RnfC
MLLKKEKGAAKINFNTAFFQRAKLMEQEEGMIKKPFFALASPGVKYPIFESREMDAVTEIPLPKRASFLVRKPQNSGNGLIIKGGDKVRTGQRLALTAEGGEVLLSTVTGTISAVSQHTGYLGEDFISISVDVAEEDRWDGEFERAGKIAEVHRAARFLASLPGKADFAAMINYQPHINTVIINGIDQDFLVTTNQLIMKTRAADLSEGINYIKKIAGVETVILLLSPEMSALAEDMDVAVKTMALIYPNTLPKMVIKSTLGKEVPAGQACEASGVGFINAEAVAALARAFGQGLIPVDKVLTVIKKDGSRVHAKARIGTTVKDILEALKIETDHGDRVVLGGPMTGQALYSEDTPIAWDTDAIMVQDREQIVKNSDSQCVHCGECVRACPAKIPVNMLVRLLENGLYEEAVSEYDLLSCIECGLCSYVCIARIPVFHYIMLGKYEFARIQSAEEANAESEAFH